MTWYLLRAADEIRSAPKSRGLRQHFKDLRRVCHGNQISPEVEGIKTWRLARVSRWRRNQISPEVEGIKTARRVCWPGLSRNQISPEVEGIKTVLRVHVTRMRNQISPEVEGIKTLCIAAKNAPVKSDQPRSRGD